MAHRRQTSVGRRAGACALLASALAVAAAPTTAQAEHQCVVQVDGSVKCWGRNTYGQLGQGDTGNRGYESPEMYGALQDVDLGAGRLVVQMSSGANYACAVLDDGSLKCWGYNGYGNLGQGDTAHLGDHAGEMGDDLDPVDLGADGLGQPLAVAEVSAATEHACALLDGGLVKCWGRNHYGQLGQGDTTQRGDNPNEMGGALPPVDLGTGYTATQLDGFSNHHCAVLQTGELKCWGYNGYGQLGQGDTYNRGTQPPEMYGALQDVQLGAGRSVAQIAMGSNANCAVLDDGSLKCWGYNGYGQLGQGNTAHLGDHANELGDGLPTVALGAGHTATMATLGEHHACALLDDGSVKCWGRNNYGQLGQGDTTQRGDQANEMGDNLAAVDLGTGHTAARLDATQDHTCAVLDNGRVKCWGRNDYGQLGQEDTHNRGTQQPEMYGALADLDLGAGRAVTAMEANPTSTCATLDDGSLKCWGYNGYGQLGQGNTAHLGDHASELGDDLPTVDLGAGRAAVAFDGGQNHACAVLDDGSVKCWGRNHYGQLGQGDTTQRGDQANEMGDNLPTVDLGTGYTAADVSAGGDFSCATLQDGAVKCWGYNGYGQLGQEDTHNRGTQQPEMYGALADLDLGAGRTVSTMDLGESFSCAILDDGSLKCWGYNGYGQLGLGHTSHIGNSANEVGDGVATVDLGLNSQGQPHTVADVSSGRIHTCAVLDDGQVKCWGYNGYGQLGQGDTTQRGDGANEMGDNLAYADLGTGYTATDVEIGGDFSCALLNDGAVKCWGYNGYGNLGQGDTTNRGTQAPEMYGALADLDLGGAVSAVEIGNRHTCAILDDGRLKCWGYNGNGQLGIGNTSHIGNSANEMGASLATTDLGADRTPVDVSMGQNHSCAALDDGAVKCWGYNGYGNLGQGDTAQRGDGANEMGDDLAPVPLGAGRTSADVEVGGEFSCAILDDGAVKCWGYNSYGNLGQGDTATRGTAPPERFGAIEDMDLGTGRAVAQADSDGNHMCAVLDNNQVKCWGRNNRGQLGLGNSATIGNSANELGDGLAYADLGTDALGDPLSVAEVQTGSEHTCARLTDGRVKCWGANSSGQLGLGHTTQWGDNANEIGDSLPFVDLGEGHTAAALSLRDQQSCAILDDGAVKCWGYNGYGNLGQGDTATRGSQPQEMYGSLQAIDLGAGRTVERLVTGGYHTCAILDDDSLKCWGRNNNGQLGLGNTSHTGNSANEMGDGLAAVNLGAGRAARDVALGATYTCALLDNDRVKCWGYNGHGNLGQGNTTQRGDGGNEMGDSLAYTDLGGDVSGLWVGGYHACGRLTSGAVKCWGLNNYGQLGLGDTAYRGDGANEMGASLPAVDLGAGATVQSMALGTYHSCALLSGGAVKCWGYNSHGNLGYGDTTRRGDNANEMGASLLAVDLGAGRAAVKITAGEYHTCALLDDDSVKCWGYNNRGQLGLGDTAYRGDSANEMGDNLNTVDFGGGLSAVDVSSHGNHTCALLSDASVKCWGENNNGEAGVGHTDHVGDEAGELGAAMRRAQLPEGSPVVAISGGLNQSCARFADGAARCWGYNGYGVLGYGDSTQRGDQSYAVGRELRPIDLGAGRTAAQVSAGTHHVCALLDDNSVKCWGRNDLGQLGQGNSAHRGDHDDEMGDSLAVTPLGTDNGAPLTTVKIAAGGYHTCALFDDGRAKCWGYNNNGQLGQGHTGTRGTSASHMGDNLPFLDVGAGRTITDIEAGGHHTCATLDDDTVKCWGENNNGEAGVGHTRHLGDGPSEMGDDLQAAHILYGRPLAGVIAAENTSCALFNDGQMQCWGYNGYGQLLTGDTQAIGDLSAGLGDDLAAIPLGGGRTATQLAAGHQHVCALLDDNSVKCWGRNDLGQLGQGNSAHRGDHEDEMGDSLAVTQLGTDNGAPLTVAQLVAGDHHTCARLDDGRVKCWGYNNYGQLGHEHTSTRGTHASHMGDNLPFVALGDDAQGQPLTASHLQAGSNHTCATLSNNTVKCWGLNSSGQLGLGDTANRGDGPDEMGDDLQPVKVRFDRQVIASYGGGAHSCLRFADGAVKCWGSNGHGRLGYGDTLSRGDITGGVGDDLDPVDLGDGVSVAQLSVGYYHACALTTAGEVKCWGYNGYGNLGQGNSAQRGDGANEMGASLTAVDFGTDNGAPLTAVALVSGHHHNCARLSDGQVKCWGYNAHGQLGQGSTAARGDHASELGDSLAAVDLGVGRSAVALAAGANHTCALLDNAKVKCWGYNGNGQLGLVDTANRGDAPGEMGDDLPYAALPYDRPVVALTAGDAHTCAVYDDGGSKCWGSNGYGRLGYGDSVSRGDTSGGLGDDLPYVDLGADEGGDPLLAEEVATGYLFSCALLDSGRVKCWGYNGYGNLGHGNNTQRGDQPGEMGDNLPYVDLGTDSGGAPLRATLVKAGTYYACALLEDDSVKCWGYSGHGQLGQGSTATRGDHPSELGDNLAAVDFGPGLHAVDLDVYYYHACATLNDDTVKCWGYNAHGQLGLLDTAARGDQVSELGDGMERVKILYDRPIAAVATGYLSSCVVFTDGQMKCWGSNSYGLLLQGDSRARGDVTYAVGDDLDPIDLGTNAQGQPHTVDQVITGDNFTCALLEDGHVKCWGYNGYGNLAAGHTAHLGDAPHEMGDNLPYVDLGPGRTAARLTAGYNHACAELDDGAVRCWGYNGYGNLGHGNTATRGDHASELGDNLAAVDFGGGRLGAAVTSGAHHVCAAVEGEAKCWGYNSNGQLGLGHTDHIGNNADEMGDHLASAQLLTDRDVTGFSLGDNFTCALLEDGHVKCWGYNGYGNLGYGDTRQRGDRSGGMGRDLQIVRLGAGQIALSVAQGYRHNCALFEEGGVKCWGYNGYGQLGYGDTANRGDQSTEMGDALAFVDLGAGRTALSVAAGYDFTCALLDNNQVKCWGYNGYGNLGHGNTTHRGDHGNEMGDSLPYVDLGAGRSATAITAGDYHACAILNDGAVKCWGYNGNGQLGQGDRAHRGDGGGELGDALPSVDLGAGRTAQIIEGGAYHTCAILDNGEMKCWGYNGYGNLGHGDTTQRGDGANEMGGALPYTDLGANRRALAVSAGNHHTCALLDDQTMKCWGYNSHGQLGYGDSAHRGDGAGEMSDALAAVDLGPGRSPRSIIAHHNHTCAALDDDTLSCWGYNGYGNLGRGDTLQTGDNANEMGVSLVRVDLGLGAIDPRSALNNGNPVACEDSDEDGLCDGGDNCPAVANLDQADRDLDGIGDVCDVCPDDALNDGDNDGLCGSVDNCPAVANPGQENADGDDQGDACDVCAFDADNDEDGDGICGDVDNCPALANVDQRDDDADGFGDACVATDAEIGPDTLIDPTAVISSGCVIGNGVQVGAHSVLKANCRLDSNSRVGAHSEVGISGHLHAFASLGDNTTLGDGASLGTRSHLGDDTTVAADVTIGYSVVIGDRATVLGDVGASVSIGEDFSLGLGGQILNNLIFGARVSLGANSLVESNARIGADVQLGDEAFVGDYTRVGADVTFGPRPYLADGALIGEGVTGGADAEIRGFVDADAALGDSVYVGVQAEVGPRATLGDNTAVSNYATLGEDSALADDVRIYDRATVGPRAQLGANTVVLFNADVGADFTMGTDGIVDDSATVGEGCTFGDNSRIWPFTQIGPRGSFGGGVLIGLRAVVGEDAVFEDLVILWEDAVIGDRVTLRRGAEVRYRASVASDTEIAAGQIVER